MQTTVEYRVIDANGLLVASADNRQTPIRVAAEVCAAIPGYIKMPCEVVRIVTEKETIGWVIQ